MNNKPAQSKTERLRISCGRGGFVLAAMLCTVVILIILGTALLSLGLHSRVFAVRTSSEISARCAADAGLTKAFYEMNEKLKVIPWDDSSLPQATDEILPNTDATYSYTVTGDMSSGYVIESSGKSGVGEKAVLCSLSLQGPLDFAVFSNSQMVLRNSAEIDWYNYDDEDENLKVGTNSIEAGAVELKNSIKIHGDVVVGPGGDPDTVINQGNAITIEGDTYAASKEKRLPSPAVPAWLEEMFSGGTINNNETITTSGKYDSIQLGNSKEIQIEGDVSLYITGDISLGNSCKITVNDDGSSSLVIYLSGQFEGKNSSELNNGTKNPRKLKIYGMDSCTNMQFKNSSTTYGVIYAPKADIVFHNSIDLYGAIACKSLDLKNSAKIYYDASLRDASINDVGTCFVVKQWREE